MCVSDPGLKISIKNALAKELQEKVSAPWLQARYAEETSPKHIVTSSPWMRCVRTHTIIKHGGILAHGGEAKGTTGSLNPCPDITVLVGPWGLTVFHSWFFLIFLIFLLLSYLPTPVPLLLYLFTLLTSLITLKLGWAESRTEEKLWDFNYPD